MTNKNRMPSDGESQKRNGKWRVDFHGTVNGVSPFHGPLHDMFLKFAGPSLSDEDLKIHLEAGGIDTKELDLDAFRTEAGIERFKSAEH